MIELSLCLAALLSRAFYVYATADMWPYAVTFIAVAVFPLALAGYGGHLATLALGDGSSRKKIALAIVWGLATCGVIVFGISQIMSYTASTQQQNVEMQFRDAVLSRLGAIASEPDEAKRKEAANSLKAVVLQSPIPHPIHIPVAQDELLVSANKELQNCNDFLARSKYRELHTYPVSIAIAEDKQNQEFNDNLDKYDLGAKPPAVAKTQHEGRQAQIDKEERRFSADEVNTWENTYGPEFEPAYHKMMAAVGNPRDFDSQAPMKNPETLFMIQHECTNLGALIQEYEAMTKPPTPHH
ncbi:MAG TPA: hypothetical protein VFU55_10850 [Terracidiphilus sp.]|nr:hypothetical protein [Terracidiphilus sp.]